MPNYKMNHQGIDQTNKDLSDPPSYAYPTSQPVSLSDGEHTKTSKFRLCTGYVSASSGTQIVVCRLYP
jgi:hypothetical protein